MRVSEIVRILYQNAKITLYIYIPVCMLLIHFNILTSEPTIDCEWNEWQIGGCTTSCGKGYRTKSRTKKVEEANGGTCDGESTEHELCTSAPCPSKLSKLSIIHIYLQQKHNKGLRTTQFYYDV